MTGPIQCLIVDDKPLAIDILTAYVAQVPALHLAGSSQNPVEALHWVAERRVELIFLDIQMPQLTGLQFMQALDRRAQVVLTTAYAEHALTGFEHDHRPGSGGFVPLRGNRGQRRARAGRN